MHGNSQDTKARSGVAADATPSKTLVRKDLADTVYRNGNLSRQEATVLVNAVLDKIVETVASGEQLKLHGFGKFTILSKKARVGRNPRTGVEAAISARKTVSFRPSPNFIEALNDD